VSFTLVNFLIYPHNLYKTGGVFYVSSLGSPPWTSFQFYDVISDVWTTKTALGGNLLSALGTDFAIEVITEESAFLSGRTSSEHQEH
jgi:hypothetical protein